LAGQLAPTARRDAAHVSHLLALAAAAIAVPLVGWLFWALVLRLGANDFHDYWLAGRLLLEGRSPYDLAALRDLAAHEHLTLEVGGGYSYPLPFALAMTPLAMLPYGAAQATFSVISLAAFGMTTAAWIPWAHGRSSDLGRRRLALALGAGLYPPVYGTVVNGQANLVVLPFLALGAILALDESRTSRRAGGGVLIGLAAIVKLVPAVLIVPLALGRRAGAAVAVMVGALGALLVAVAVAPWAAAGSGGLAALFDPDPYYTNQSINGFVTRLVQPTGRTMPLFERAFDPRPAMIALTALFAVLTLALLWHYRAALRTRRGAALGMAFVLVAGVAGAPKDSFWNETMCLVAAGLLLAVDAPDLRFGRFDRRDRCLLGVWLGTAFLWAAVWAIEPSPAGAFAPIVNLMWSSSLYGLLALWLLFARRLRQAC
jgi:hypothetical protein